MRPLRSYPNPDLLRWGLPGNVQNCTFWYRCGRIVALFSSTLVCRIRAFNRHHEPTSGGVLYISNHQTFLDPLLTSCMLQRPGNYMARHSLFRSRAFSWLIRSFNAFPVHRGSADVAALKEAMRRLKAGAQLVLFPEGTRTRDGRIGPLLPGVSLLAQRAAAWVVPVVIDGAFEVWPRTQPLPGLGNTVVQYGQPMSQAEARAIKSRDLPEYIRGQMIAIQAEIRERLGRPPIQYDQ